jgi:hypothetical protein
MRLTAKVDCRRRGRWQGFRGGTPTGGNTLAEAPTFPLMIRSEFPMIELFELLSPSFEMWTFETAAPTGELWNWYPMSPNPPVLTCASPPASTLAQRVSPLPEPPKLAPIPMTTPQCD